MTNEKNSTVYISLDQAESARQQDVNTLLPRNVYEDLSGFIKVALEKGKKARDASNSKLTDFSIHNAILIDGTRGTGKTSVLVNLPLYLNAQNADESKRVHILAPVDPTLLESHDDLFLQVIVAAVLSDDAVRQAQENSPENKDRLLRQLQQLSTALEGIQSQAENRGLDKLRSLIGNKQLAEKIHEFFGVILKLLDKDLLVLTIDDVDTSLNRAFENLEIVRRYLVTPFVLPIISGDRSLYHEVTWRDFHGRLQEDSRYKREQAYQIAIDLAAEYQRKVLPVPYRLYMPEIKQYLNDDSRIKLRNSDGKEIHLSAFYGWLSIFIAGPVNNLENSQLDIPIPSVRALSQLINRCRSWIPHLPQKIINSTTKVDAQRAWQMPGVDTNILRKFSIDYAKDNENIKRDRHHVYISNFGKATELLASSPLQKAYVQSLLDHFKHEKSAGAVYLTLEAMNAWYQVDSKTKSVFDTRLFQPLRHEQRDLENFDKKSDFEEWKKNLQNKLPESWLSHLPKQAILPYPVPEVGMGIPPTWKYWENDVQTTLLVSFLVHHNFYSSARRGLMINIGRLFELIISSLVRDIDYGDILRLLLRAPLHASSALAPTKSSIGDAEEEVEEVQEPEELGGSEELDAANSEAVTQLVAEIKMWRESHQLSTVQFSPWLIYNVFNKVFNQAQIFNHAKKNDLVITEKQAETKVPWIARQIFYSTWAAFGSFEKGSLFGLPDYISTTNIGNKADFQRSDLFIHNINPFYPGSDKTDFSRAVSAYGKLTRTATYFLGNHPLRAWVDKLQAPPSNESLQKMTPTKWLVEQLTLPEETVRVSKKDVVDAMSEHGISWSEALILKMENEFPNNPKTADVKNLFKELFAESNSVQQVSEQKFDKPLRKTSIKPPITRKRR